MFLLSCNKPQQEIKDSAMSEISSVESKIPNSSAAVENNADSSRSFIRTAEMKFKVKDVFEATSGIEDITATHGGFVTYTNLTSSTDEVKKVSISADSSAETTFYTVANSITLRVPNKNLDSLLKDVSRSIDHLDFRIIKADDVALQLLANKKAINRNTKSEKRISQAIDAKGKVLNSIIDAEQTLLNRNEEIDEKDMSNLSLKDQIDFSTVQLSVYQRRASKVELVATEKYFAEYKAPFGSHLKDSLLTGWLILELLLLAILKIWPLILIGLTIGFVYKRNKFKRRVLAAHSS